jgi:tetratricopeptide (TPR) repeat protein
MMPSMHTKKQCKAENPPFVHVYPLSAGSNLAPNDAQVWCSLGSLYHQHAQYTDALGMYARALVLNPSMPDTWFNVGVLYETCGQVKHTLRS